MTVTNTQEIDLIKKAARGDAAAFALLFERHFQPIYNYAITLCRDAAEADDITQETFIRAHDKIDTLQAPYNLRSWLFRLARNIFVDMTGANRQTFHLRTAGCSRAAGSTRRANRCAKK